MRPSSESVNATRRAQATELIGLFRVEESIDSTFRLAAQDTFQRTYYDQPDAFVTDCIIWGDNEHPADYQLEILADIPLKKRLAIRAAHGAGKSTLSAFLVLWFALTRDGEDWKIVTTASAWRQLTKYLWPEIHKWARRLRWDKIGREPFTDVELLQLSLRLRTGEAFAVASNKHELIEGAHADQILYVFDESKIIPAATFDAAEGAFSTGQALALSISTPGEPVGRFYDIHARKPGYEDWSVRHITIQEAIAAGRLRAEWVEQRKRQWGETSAVYQNRVAGEFCQSDADGIIPLAWVEAANERWRLWDDNGGGGVLSAVAGDIARSEDGDRNAIAKRYTVDSDECKEAISLEKFHEIDTMVTTGRLAAAASVNPEAEVVVDVVGLGGGPVDRLREQGYKVTGFHPQHKTDARDKSNEFSFDDLKSAAWWNLREMLDPLNNVLLALPPYDTLTGDLTAPHYRINSQGKIEVEGKNDHWLDREGKPRATLRERLGRSPDEGECVVMVCMPKKLLGSESVVWEMQYIDL